MLCERRMQPTKIGQKRQDTRAAAALWKLVNYGLSLRFGMLYKSANNLKVALEQFNRDLFKIWVEIGV